MGYTAYERETTFNTCDAERVVYVESYQRKYINQILAAKEKADANIEKYKAEGIEVGDELKVEILERTESMISAIIPRGFLRISAPPYVSAERRQAMQERAKARFGKAENEDDASEDVYEDDIYEDDAEESYDE